MTYREKLQEVIETIEKQNGAINYLRDNTDPEKKRFINSARGALYDAIEQLNKLDNSLNTSEASLPVYPQPSKKQL